MAFPVFPDPCPSVRSAVNSGRIDSVLKMRLACIIDARLSRSPAHPVSSGQNKTGAKVELPPRRGLLFELPGFCRWQVPNHAVEHLDKARQSRILSFFASHDFIAPIPRFLRLGRFSAGGVENRPRQISRIHGMRAYRFSVHG